jgi:hypothetical protein
MPEILHPKIQYSGLADLVGVGVVKQFEEKLTSPIIGNGTLTSGAIKLIGGGLLHGKGGRLGNIASSAILVDAGEDLAIGLMSLLGGGLGGSSGNTKGSDGFSS